jgi:hypothetical protein
MNRYVIKRKPDRQSIWNYYGRRKKLNRKRRAPKSKNEIGEGIKRITDPGLIDWKSPCDTQVNVNGKIKIRKLYDLVFTITMKSCLIDLV